MCCLLLQRAQRSVNYGTMSSLELQHVGPHMLPPPPSVTVAREKTTETGRCDGSDLGAAGEEVKVNLVFSINASHVEEHRAVWRGGRRVHTHPWR